LYQKNPDVDILVLAIVQIPTVRFVGWANIDEIRRPEHLMDFGYGKCYALEQGHPLLKPIEMLEEIPAILAGEVCEDLF
jgi:hypothetical protein